jgi:hypothetical protein
MFMLHPGDCSPSRRVVSKMMTRSIAILEWGSQANL